MLRRMSDPRWSELARQLAGYSLSLETGENVLVDLIDIPDGFAIALIRAIRACGATPFVESRRSRIQRELLMEVEEPQVALAQKIELNRMKKMQAYIAVRGAENSSETTDVPGRATPDFLIQCKLMLTLRHPNVLTTLGLVSDGQRPLETLQQ